ncbi:MAG: hypothetical protein M3Y21_02245 [Candidatus Eremiobacteraeota bacterium]|nr:hypothetical protein [Candidatus Eremiobacteraeota bacterium]
MTSGNSIFTEVIEWFLTRVGDRRQYKRRAGAFHLWCPEAANMQGVGTELSASGLVFIIPQPLSAPEYNLVLGIREQKLPVRVRTTRNDQIEYQGKRWHRYMGEFRGIGADHWDTIVRYVNDTPEPIDRRKLHNQEMTDKVDDAYRLLPLAIQQKIIKILVAQRKLEEPKPGLTPLLKLFYGGLQKQAGAAPMHRFNVHSRISINDETFAYDTRFLVGDSGEVKFSP